VAVPPARGRTVRGRAATARWTSAVDAAQPVGRTREWATNGADCPSGGHMRQPPVDDWLMASDLPGAWGKFRHRRAPTDSSESLRSELPCWWAGSTGVASLRRLRCRHAHQVGTSVRVSPRSSTCMSIRAGSTRWRSGGDRRWPPSAASRSHDLLQSRVRRAIPPVPSSHGPITGAGDTG